MENIYKKEEQELTKRLKKQLTATLALVLALTSFAFALNAVAGDRLYLLPDKPVVVDEENKVIYLYREKVDEETFKSFFEENAYDELVLSGLVPATIVVGEGDEAEKIETELIATGSTLTILNKVVPLTAMCDADEDETEEPSD